MHSPSRMPSKYYASQLRGLQAEAADEHGFGEAAIRDCKQQGYF
jgi:hypothetical protein